MQSAEIPRIGKQLNLPGFDTSPKSPTTFEEAYAWLRKHCKVVQVWNEDIDILKITLEVDDPEGLKRKFYQETEVLTPGKIESCAPIIVRIAQDAFAFKQVIESGQRFGF